MVVIQEAWSRVEFKTFSYLNVIDLNLDIKFCYIFSMKNQISVSFEERKALLTVVLATKKRKKFSPKCALTNSVSFNNLKVSTSLCFQMENLSLQGSMEWPVRISPRKICWQWRISEKHWWVKAELCSISLLSSISSCIDCLFLYKNHNKVV